MPTSQSRRRVFSRLLFAGLSIAVGIGFAVTKHWIGMPSNVSPSEYVHKSEWKLVATFAIAGEEYRLKQPVDAGCFVPNQLDLLLAVTDAQDNVLYTQQVPGHRYGFPEPIVEIGDYPVLVLSYPELGFIDCDRVSEIKEFTGTRLRYRITPSALERLGGGT